MSSLTGYLESYKSKEKYDVALYRLELSKEDRKKVESNLKNSTKGLVEFTCKGDRCAKEGTTTARKNGKYYLATGKQKYSLDSNNCAVFVIRQFKGTSIENDINVGILPSGIRDYAINAIGYNRKKDEEEMKRISEKEKTDIGTITRKYRYKLPKITNSNFLVYTKPHLNNELIINFFSI